MFLPPATRAAEDPAASPSPAPALPAASPAPPRSASVANLIFSHELHKKELDCADCHEQPGVVPAMDTCMTCHRAAGCRQCHLKVAGAAFRPASHDAFWRARHGLSTHRELGTCASCHPSSSCQACHQGDIARRVHDSPFRRTHGIEARLMPGRCETCHLTPFCKTCHAEVGR
jgi:hypothetical protein